MSLWSWLLWRRRVETNVQRPAASAERWRAAPQGAIPLPTEPYVFECRLCGKVFEVRRRRPLCPECDSDDVELLSD